MPTSCAITAIRWSTCCRRLSCVTPPRCWHAISTAISPYCCRIALKEADIIAAQLVKALDILPITPLIDSEDVLHIGICAYASGQSSEQVMESVEDATRNAVLQGGNGWCVFDRQVPDKGRGSVKWRTLLEQTLAKGGPHLYQKPAVTQDGVVHHREIMPRITDGEQVLLAAEYMPLVRQLGLTPNYDRLLVTQIIALSASWPEETLAMPVNMDSLLQRPFLRWLQEVLLQCPRQQRQHILFELAESDVCQYIERLRPILNTLVGLGCRLAVTQAGLTVVSTTYILHQGATGRNHQVASGSGTPF